MRNAIVIEKSYDAAARRGNSPVAVAGNAKIRTNIMHNAQLAGELSNYSVNGLVAAIDQDYFKFRPR